MSSTSTTTQQIYPFESNQEKYQTLKPNER